MLNLRSVDLNLLPIFEAVYEERSLSRAATRLAMTQPAVSHALARIHLTFGDDLFVRHSRGMNPTPVADALYERVSQALLAIRAAVEETRGFDPKSSHRRFVVAIAHPLGAVLALRLLERMAAEAPNVTLSFTTRSRPVDVERGLLDSRIDLAIDWLPTRRSGLGNEPVARDEIVVVARRGHPALERKRSREWLIENCRFVTLRPRAESEQHPVEGVREWLKMKPATALEVAELLEVLAVASTSDLLGIVPRSLVVATRFIGVEIVRVTTAAARLPVLMTWRESRGADPALSFLRKQAREVAVATLKLEPPA